MTTPQKKWITSSIKVRVNGTGKKNSLVEKLAVEELSISYSRVLEIQENIAKQLCQQNLGEGIVCPNLEKRLFTVVLIDNVDQDPSTTAKRFFQGASISVYQKNKINLPHNNCCLQREDTHEFFLSYFS